MAHKRIDLVVEGDEGVQTGGRVRRRCMARTPSTTKPTWLRQRQLERAGWRFVRVRECLFYADEAQAIQEVVDACAELEILSRRGGAAVADRSPWTRSPTPRSSAEAAAIASPLPALASEARRHRRMRLWRGLGRRKVGWSRRTPLRSGPMPVRWIASIRIPVPLR